MTATLATRPSSAAIPTGGHPGGAVAPVGSVKHRGYVFSRAPMLVYGETTLACGLACTHCRARC